MLNFSASDFRVDATDSACVNTDACTLSDIPANSHIRTKDTIEGVIRINQNTTCKLTKGGSDSRHDWCWDVDSVLTDCVVVPSDIIQPGFFRIVLEDDKRNHHVHKLGSFIHSSTSSILHKILINYLAKTSIGEQHITIMVNVCPYLINLFLRVFGKDVLIIKTIICKFGNVVTQSWCSTILILKDLLTQTKEKQSSSNKLIVWMIQINQVTSTSNENFLNFISSNAIIELNSRLHLHLRSRNT